MAIGKAVQDGEKVNVYDGRNVQIGMYYGDLHGFTSSTVIIRRADRIYTYDEHGIPISNEPAD